MTHTDTQQAIREIMESLGENIECDQLINKLVEKDIITRDDVTRINMIEEQDKMQELLMVILEKDRALHPLALKILENLKSPSHQNTRRTEQAIAEAAAGTRSGEVSRPSTERRILTNAEVSGDWALKNFLFELSKEIGKDEFNDMKDLMHGESGFKSSALKKIERPMQFFKQMMNTGRLNAYNLHFLQALVRRIGRKDLNEKVREFCLDCHKQPIHFFTPSETPENGYRYVKHHIEGDIEKLTHIEKERLRAELADILCVPLMFVYIKGIEPAGSLLFTFMVPEEDVSSFIHMYVREGPSLLEVSVHIQIHEDQLSLSEMPPSEKKTPKPMLHQLRNLLEREQSLQEQLEERDDKLLDLQAELDSKEGDSTVDQVLHGEDVEEEDTRELRYQCQLYKSLFTRMVEYMKTMPPREIKNGANGMTGSLKLYSASALYKQSLKQIMQQCNAIQIDLVNKLLDTRSLVENTVHEERLRNMQDIIAMLNQRVEELSVMNGVLRMSSSMVGGSSTFLQDILTIQNETRAHAIEQAKQQDEPHGLEVNGIIGLQVVQRIYPGPIEIKIKPEQQQLLDTITKELSSKEKQRLKTFLCFSEVEKEELKRHPDKLLELALMREIRMGGPEPMENILGGILAKINKAHVIYKYLNIPEPPPKITTRRSGEKRRYKRFGRSETPQRPRPDSGETNH